MNRLNAAVAFLVTVVITLPFDGFAWNISTYMITGAIAHRLLEGTEPGKAAAIEAILKQHLRYAEGWRESLETIPQSQRARAIRKGRGGFVLVQKVSGECPTKSKRRRWRVYRHTLTLHAGASNQVSYAKTASR